MNQEDIFTVYDVAKHFKMTKKTVYGLTPKGDLPAFNDCGHWRFRRTAIDSWIEGKTQTAGVRPANDGAKPSRSNRED